MTWVGIKIDNCLIWKRPSDNAGIYDTLFHVWNDHDKAAAAADWCEMAAVGDEYETDDPRVGIFLFENET